MAGNTFALTGKNVICKAVKGKEKHRKYHTKHIPHLNFPSSPDIQKARDNITPLPHHSKWGKPDTIQLLTKRMGK